MDITSAGFWAALGSIVLANVVLSGDNAVVIALAARSLPPQQQTRAIVWGSVAAIALRVMLTLAAAAMLQWPGLKIVGALLLYIGITLLRENERGIPIVSSGASLMTAIRTILIADLVMSLDNVLAVAAVAQGNSLLLAIGLAISVPLIAFGSTLLIGLMDRLPFLTMLGAALLGGLAGNMLVEDPFFATHLGTSARRLFQHFSEHLPQIASAAGAFFVVAVGWGLQRIQRRSLDARL